jgi:DNA polymerase, archaea type
MKVPVIITQKGDYDLSVYHNNKVSVIKKPFKPYLLVQANEFSQYISGPAEKWTKVPQLEERDYIRCSFNTNKELAEFKSIHSDKSRYMFNNPYLEQLYISSPDTILKYPHETDLKILYFDIEVASRGDGLFPRASTNPVLCIGYSVWLYHQDGTKTCSKREVIKAFNKTDLDAAILAKFVSDIHTEDPDVIAGYNSDAFDWPYLIERAAIMKISTDKIGRHEKGIVYEAERTENKIRIPGRINFDLYLSNAGVKKDQTLFGLKSRSLKAIARHYKAKIDDIEVKEDIENLLNLWETDPETLYRYQLADVTRTEHVGNVYIRNCITLAEMMCVPLGSIVNMYSSFVPKLMMGRHMEKKKLINTETNFQKYNPTNGSVAKLGSKFQGALVGLYKDGFFEKSFKLDFTSQYPSAIQTWNLGPDTTFFAGVREFTGQYTFSEDNKYKWYRIPDENFNVDVIIKVSKESDGFLKQEITRMKNERKRIKKDEAAAPPELKDTFKSQQWAIKVLMNSIYGTLGLQSSLYGDMMSGMMVTAMCRWTTTYVMKRIPDKIIEVDTDGIITNALIDEKETNDCLNKIMLEKFNITDNYMSMESEEFGRSFFYAMKTYVVEKDGKHVIHGSSIMSSKASKVVDRAVRLAIQHVFNSKPVEEVLHEAHDFTGLELEDFEERMSLRKEQREYDNQADMRLLLAKQVELKTNRVLTMGDQINFAVTKSRLPFKELDVFNNKTGGGWNYTFSGYVNNVTELDYKYYNDLIDKALAKFGIKKIEQLELDLGFVPSKLSRKTPLNKLPR